LFDFILDFLTRRKRVRKQALSPQVSQKKEAAAHLSSELAELQRSLTDGNVHAKAKEFYHLAKKAFKLSLGIEREVTFQEIAEEIELRRHYPDDMRKHALEFLEDIGMMEYGYEDFKELMAAKRHEKEKALRVYIEELEKQNTHIKKETKRRYRTLWQRPFPARTRSSS
jgi:uncharacterized protein YnzC (UPF0291/DUF896 family)